MENFNVGDKVIVLPNPIIRFDLHNQHGVVTYWYPDGAYEVLINGARYVFLWRELKKDPESQQE